MKESQEQSKIILDKNAIFKSLEKIGEYKNEKLKLTIKKWEDDDVISNMFIIKIEGNCSFFGVINGLFEREGFGVNTYSNGDSYFGYFSENESQDYLSYDPGEDTFLKYDDNKEKILSQLSEYISKFKI